MNTVEIYDPVANTWSTGAPMPTARQQPGAAPTSTGFFVVGGNVTGVPNGENEFWSSSSNTWATRAPMPLLRYQVMAAEAGGLIYVTGAEAGNAASNRLYIYVP